LLTGAVSLAADEGAEKLAQARMSETTKLKEVLTSITREYLRTQPEVATSLAISVEQAGGKYSDRLSDYSEAEAIRMAATTKEWLAQLDQVNANLLAEGDRVSLDVVRTALTNNLKAGELLPGRDGLPPVTASALYVVNQLECAFVSVPDFLDSKHSLQSAADAEDYLKRLSAYATVLGPGIGANRGRCEARRSSAGLRRGWGDQAARAIRRAQTF
jgi:uncharacterized protein (DUF885 family)